MAVNIPTHSPWAERYAGRVFRLRSSAVRELLKATSRPDVISFAGGLPAPDLFPIERFQHACQDALTHHGREALQYGATEGYPPLRELVARHASRFGAIVDPANVLVTTGSQQALDLIGTVFLEAGDRVLVERPTYLGALQAWNTRGPKYLPMDVDEDGLTLDQLERALWQHPKFIYVQPNYQNPTGATLSMFRREAVVRIACDRRIPVLEDDPYGPLSFDEEPRPSLLALDARHRKSDRIEDGSSVLALGTFSKVLAPGLRLGWIVGPREVIERLALAKQGADLHTSTFSQVVAYEVARGGFLDEHIRRLRTVYRARRDAMLDAMARHFPAEVRWTRPGGGLFLWVTLPGRLNAAHVLQAAIGERVVFVPGQSFFADGAGSNTLRLNFSYAPPPVIEEGIGRLGRVLHRMLESAPGPHPASGSPALPRA